MDINKNARRRRVRNVLLALLVLSSILLSFFLWTAGKSIREEERNQNQENSTRVSVIAHSMEEVYRPKLVALHGIQGNEPLMIASSHKLIEVFEDIMKKSNLTKIEKIETMEKEKYLEKIQRGSWIEFVYPENLPFGLISSKFSDLSEEDSPLFFDRILFDQIDSSKIYFYHMNSESFYTVKRKNERKIGMTQLLDRENINYIAAQAVFLNQTMKYLPVSSVDIPYQSYIANQFSKRSYINIFFQDTSLVDVRSANNYSRYIDLTKEVTIDENSHVLTYLSQIYTSGEMKPEDRYVKSFQQLNQFENWSDGLIFSSYNAEKNRLSYRREIDGVSVFSENEDESISEISLVEDGITHMKLPLRFINTPIDIKNSPEKTLVSGLEIVEELRKNLTEEDFQLIQDFRIGYSWLESEEDNQVINFEPNWYVFYKDKWYIYSSLLELNKETVYGF